ncbi:MAG TPA: carboxypeptidase regulatory-like domain-containing protein [Polyangia bacterium]
MNRYLGVALVWSAAVLVGCSDPAAATTGNFSGVVVEEGVFTPITGADVNVAGTHATTDESGLFVVKGLAVGSCAVTITAAGYRPFATTVEVKPGNTAGQTFWLQRADGDGGVDDGPAGGDGPASGDGGGVSLERIEVAPGDLVVELDLQAAGNQPYTATGHYHGGGTADLTSQVTWASSNGALGAFSGATLQIAARAAVGVAGTTVTATLGGVTGAAQLSVLWHRQTGAQADVVFVLPYQDPAGPQTQQVVLDADVPRLDLFLAADTTGSMGQKLAALQGALAGTIVASVRGVTPDSQFGVGAFEEFPVSPYGATSGTACAAGASTEPDQPFRLLQAITADTTAVQTGAGRLTTAAGVPIGCGLDQPEAMLEAMYQVATGEGLTGPAPTSVPANHTGVGGVGFRAGAMPVVVPITDAVSHAPGETGTCGTDPIGYTGAVAAIAHTRQQTRDALQGICGRVVGIAVLDTSTAASCSPLADEEDLARVTGARVTPGTWDVGTRPTGCAAGQCCTDFDAAGRAPDADGLCPLVFKVKPDATGLAVRVATGVTSLARFAPFDVAAVPQGAATGVGGELLPPGKTTADFLTAVQPLAAQKPGFPLDLPTPIMDALGFRSTPPGTALTYGVTAANDLVPATAAPQLFRVVLRGRADGCIDLDGREVLVLVPPAPAP